MQIVPLPSTVEMESVKKGIIMLSGECLGRHILWEGQEKAAKESSWSNGVARKGKAPALAVGDG